MAKRITTAIGIKPRAIQPVLGQAVAPSVNAIIPEPTKSAVIKKHIVFITGAAGYVGSMLVDQFSKRPDVGRIIALDKEPMPGLIRNAPNVTYIRANTSDYSWIETVRTASPDIVIHCAWQIREMHGKKREQRLWNVHGSENVFKFAFKTPSVKRLVHFSTVASYGAYPTNTIEHRFTENEPLRKSDYLYAEEKRIVEERLRSLHEIAKRNDSNVEIAIIRPAGITGPYGRDERVRFGLQSVLSGKMRSTLLHKAVSLMTAFTPVTAKWSRQFVHEDDISDVVALLAFEPLKNRYDAFNIAPPGPVVTGKDMASSVGKRALRIHPYLIRVAFFFAWTLTFGRVPTSRGVWRAYSYPINIDGSKITKMYGYEYKMTAKDAFVKKEGRYAKYV